MPAGPPAAAAVRAGIPQVYYVGLLAGRNASAHGTDPREINRRPYTQNQVVSAVHQSVVRRLVRLFRLRNTHPAFHRAFTVEDRAGGELVVAWQAAAARVELRARFDEASFRLTHTPADDA